MAEKCGNANIVVQARSACQRPAGHLGLHRDNAGRISRDTTQWGDNEGMYTPMTTTKKMKCAHGYILMQDSCPECDYDSDTPHTADLVTVTPSWSDRPHKRCRKCGQVGAHRVHHS